jgi:hypothetical protein
MRDIFSNLHAQSLIGGVWSLTAAMLINWELDRFMQRRPLGSHGIPFWPERVIIYANFVELKRTPSLDLIQE